MAKDIYAKQGFKISNGCLVKYKGKDSVVEIPLTVSEIGEKAFYAKRKNITDITIHETVTKIAPNAFEGCFNVKCVCVPAKFVKYIPGCNFKSVIINYGEKIEDEAFAYYGELESVTIAEGVTEIGKNAFDDCVMLQEIALPDGLVKIGDMAFKDCNVLGEIDIPDSVTEIGEGAFSYCDMFVEISLPKGVTVIRDSTFKSCSRLDGFVLHEGVVSIGNNAFEDCEYLTGIEIPNSLTEIGEGAFLNCVRLERITIPKNVVSIGKDAFLGCSSLTEINCEAEAQPDGWNTEWLGECEATVNWGYKGE